MPIIWNGKLLDSAAKAKVSWKLLCHLKKEGGLGIKKLEEWNRVSMIRHIWNLFAQSGSLWVAWVKMYLLRGRSFGQLKISSSLFLD